MHSQWIDASIRLNMKIISSANINRKLDLGGCDANTTKTNVKVHCPVDPRGHFKGKGWIFLGVINLFSWMLSTEGGRNLEEYLTIGLLFPQNCIIIEVNSTHSLCAIVFEYGCNRLNE